MLYFIPEVPGSLLLSLLFSLKNFVHHSFKNMFAGEELLVYFHLRRPNFAFIPEDIFKNDSSFHSDYKILFYFLLISRVSRWEISHPSNSFPSCNVSFFPFSGCFQTFPLSLVFRSLNLMCLGMIFYDLKSNFGIC